MQLRKYLSDNGIAPSAFAASVGVSTQAVHRYLNGERTPRQVVMARIISLTKGNVQPNDFFTQVKNAA